MMRTSIETTDIFIGAFVPCTGGRLCGIGIKERARGIAAFGTRDEDLERREREYRSEKAALFGLRGRKYDRAGKDRGDKALG